MDDVLQKQRRQFSGVTGIGGYPIRDVQGCSALPRNVPFMTH